MEGSILVVHIRETKNYVPRTFTIIPDGGPVNYLEKYKQYVSLRPKNIKHEKLFVFYRNGKCSCQCVGINTFGKIPSSIATFLKLPDAEKFTGHCFRRTSATLLADSGSDITTLKRHGGWRSSTVAESYIEDSLQNKIKIAKNIVSGPSTSAVVSYSSESFSALTDVPATSLSGLNNCTFNITVQK